MFDWRALKRWGLKESNLPPGSVVLNRQATFWELYKRYVIGGVSLILLEAFLIFALLVQRARRRDAENTLAVTNDRLRTAIDAGKFVGWDFDVNAGENQWFGDLQGMFGIPSHTYSADLGEFRKRVHAEDRDAVVHAIEKAKETREPYVTEFRVNRNDGEVRWIIAQGKFRYSSDGIPERMLGLAVDITERKLAEDALTGLSGQLIEAQEEERKRIARELHDDYNQRLAMMAIDLEKLAENIDGSSAETAQQVYELCNRVCEVGADLHSLSHSLHSSTLESLGLIAGVKGFCREFAEQQGIQVDFAHENVPRGVPGDAALCMFRITQEALRNVKKHSGADRAEVKLEWLGGRLHLAVTDAGKGFEVTPPPPGSGIGLHSMEERLRVLGGRLEITSHPMQGTRLDAWLPLNVTSQKAS